MKTFLSRILLTFKKVLKNVLFQIVSFCIAIGSISIGYAAWNSIAASEGAAGQPVTQTLVQKIINNLNDLNNRIGILETGATTGGTVTGKLRWSTEYTGQTYDQAWVTCLGLTPTGSWRLPDSTEMEIGIHINSTLFSGNYWYWSSSPGYGPSGSSYGYPSYKLMLAWNPTYSYWGFCAPHQTGCSNYYGNNYAYSNAFRCVSDAY